MGHRDKRAGTTKGEYKRWCPRSKSIPRRRRRDKTPTQIQPTIFARSQILPLVTPHVSLPLVGSNFISQTTDHRQIPQHGEERGGQRSWTFLEQCQWELLVPIRDHIANYKLPIYSLHPVSCCRWFVGWLVGTWAEDHHHRIRILFLCTYRDEDRNW